MSVHPSVSSLSRRYDYNYFIPSFGNSDLFITKTTTTTTTTSSTLRSMMMMMMMMMMMITDNRCSVCRGEASTSSARCHCRTATVDVDSSSSTRCVNCGVQTAASSLCARCSALPRCRRCKRHLPKRCFRQFSSLDDDGDDENNDDGGDAERSRLCRACDRRRRKPTIRKSPDDIVTEIGVPIADSAAYNSFDSFVTTHQDQIREHVEEHRQLHRYVYTA